MNPMMMSMLSNRLGPVKQLMNAVQTAQNPALMLQQMAGSNPQLQQAMQLVQQSGGDAKAAFEKLARDNGMDPDQILAFLK